MDKNSLAFNKLTGKGLEFGALHNPISVNEKKASVFYADRLTKTDAITAFPELEDVVDEIIDADFLIDLDHDNLSIIRQEKFDFVIANHVIEHVVNPIRFLKQVSENMINGSYFFLTVPNKEFTHDVNRDLTRYRHLVIEYALKVKKLSNAHIRDYLKHKLPVESIHPKTVEYFKANNLPLSYYDGNTIPKNPIAQKRLFNYHRSRSIHVHVWNRESFDFFLRKSIKLFKLNFSIEEYLPSDVSPGEMIYLLKKETDY